MEALAQNREATSFGKIHALWTLSELGLFSRSEDQALLSAAIASDDIIVAKNALAIVAAQTVTVSDATGKTSQAVLDRLNDANLRVRLNAMLALQNMDATPAVVQAVIKAYPNLNDPWLQSAAAGVASKAPTEFIAAALTSGDPALNTLVAQLAAEIARQGDATLAARTLVTLASLPRKIRSRQSGRPRNPGARLALFGPGPRMVCGTAKGLPNPAHRLPITKDSPSPPSPLLASLGLVRNSRRRSRIPLIPALTRQLK